MTEEGFGISDLDPAFAAETSERSESVDGGSLISDRISTSDTRTDIMETMSWAGNLIKLARVESGLSQRELARRAGTSQATLSAYESGNKSPSLDTLARIIRAAGLDLRISLASGDNHDQWMKSFEANLPKSVQKARRRRDLEVINRARKQRGLAPVKAGDLR